jgi:hypothetical protein
MDDHAWGCSGASAGTPESCSGWIVILCPATAYRRAVFPVLRLQNLQTYTFHALLAEQDLQAHESWMLADDQQKDSEQTDSPQNKFQFK